MKSEYEILHPNYISPARHPARRPARPSVAEEIIIIRQQITKRELEK